MSGQGYEARVWALAVGAARRVGLRVSEVGDRRWLVRPTFLARWRRGNLGVRAVIDVSDPEDGRLEFFESLGDFVRGDYAWYQPISVRVDALWEAIEYWLVLDVREWRDDLAEAEAAASDGWWPKALSGGQCRDRLRRSDEADKKESRGLMLQPAASEGFEGWWPCPQPDCDGDVSLLDSDNGSLGVACGDCGNTAGSLGDVLAFWATPEGRRRAAERVVVLARFVDFAVLSREGAWRVACIGEAMRHQHQAVCDPIGDAGRWKAGVACARRAGLSVSEVGDCRWLVQSTFLARWRRSNYRFRVVLDVSDPRGGRAEYCSPSDDVVAGEFLWSHFVSGRVEGLWEVMEYWLLYDRRRWREDIAVAREMDRIATDDRAGNVGAAVEGVTA